MLQLTDGRHAVKGALDGDQWSACSQASAGADPTLDLSKPAARATGKVRAAALATFSSKHVRALDAQSIDVVVLQFDCHDGVISRLQVAWPR